MLLTEAARRRYMTLLHALTRAARADRLNVPRDDDDYARWISEAQLTAYRRILGLTARRDGRALGVEAEMARCAEHRFGELPDASRRPGLFEAAVPGLAEKAAAELLKDYVLLQFASSRLRTELGHDVNGRRPLADCRPDARRHSPAERRPGGSALYLTTCQTFLKLSPVLSPAFLSFEYR